MDDPLRNLQGAGAAGLQPVLIERQRWMPSFLLKLYGVKRLLDHANYREGLSLSATSDPQWPFPVITGLNDLAEVLDSM
jgi:hypothetical protein